MREDLRRLMTSPDWVGGKSKLGWLGRRIFGEIFSQRVGWGDLGMDFFLIFW